jgi:hypothetical protein
MLVALGILVLGLSTLIGLMAVGVSTRRTSELRNQAVLAVDAVVREVRARAAGTEPAAAGQQAGAPPAEEQIVFDAVPGYDRLRAVATLVRDDSEPSLLLVVVRLAWIEEGVEVAEEFHRVVPAYESFPERAARARSKS